MLVRISTAICTSETCCTATDQQRRIQRLCSGEQKGSASRLIGSGGLTRHPPQLFGNRSHHRFTVRVANPRHDGDQSPDETATNSWDERSASDAGQDKSQAAVGVDWAKVQSLAALTGASTIAAVVVLQLSGKADLPQLACKNIPDSVQEALPEQLGGKQRKAPWQQFDVEAVVQKAKVHTWFMRTAASLLAQVVELKLTRLQQSAPWP